MNIYDFHIFPVIFLPLHTFIWNQHADQLLVGLLAQLVEHCTGIPEIMGSNPIQAWIFFQALFSELLQWCSLLRRSLSYSHSNKLLTWKTTQIVFGIHLTYQLADYHDTVLKHNKDCFTAEIKGYIIFTVVICTMFVIKRWLMPF